MPGRALNVVAVGLAFVLSTACGLASCGERSQILEELAEKGKIVDDEVEEMFAHHRPEGAVIILLRYANDIDDAIKTVEKSSVINPSEKARLLRKLRLSERGVREHAKTIRMLDSIDARDH